MIYFKVFLCNKNGEGVKYMTGRRMIARYPSVNALSQLLYDGINLNQSKNIKIKKLTFCDAAFAKKQQLVILVRLR